MATLKRPPRRLVVGSTWVYGKQLRVKCCFSDAAMLLWWPLEMLAEMGGDWLVLSPRGRRHFPDVQRDRAVRAGTTRQREASATAPWRAQLTMVSPYPLYTKLLHIVEMRTHAQYGPKEHRPAAADAGLPFFPAFSRCNPECSAFRASNCSLVARRAS